MLKLVLVAALLCVSLAQYTDIDNGPGYVGEVIFSQKFNSLTVLNSTNGWNNVGVASIVEGGYLGQKALLIQNLGSTRATRTISKTIDLVNTARNTTVAVTARIKGVNISNSTTSWDGVKIALKIGSFEGLSWMDPVFTYPQKTKVWGTFDWSNTIANFNTSLSGDMSSLQIIIGLGNAIGSLYVDSVNVTIVASVPTVTQAELANLEFIGCTDFFGGEPCSLSAGVPNKKTLPNSWQIKIGSNGPAAECSVSYFPSQTTGFCDATLPLLTGSYPIFARLSPSSAWVQTKTTLAYQRQYPYTYVGCYADSTTSRKLPVRGPNVGNQMFDRCQDWCGLRGYYYAGLQSASECWCGSQSVALGTKLSDTQCNTPCTGDKRYLCGGANRNSVFYATDRTQYDYLGCYADGTPRDLPVQKTIAGGVDVFACRKACAGPYNPTTGLPEYQYAAVQNGNQCFCGNEYGNYNSAPDSYCNKTCVADPTITCGAVNLNAVWTASYNPEPYDYLG